MSRRIGVTQEADGSIDVVVPAAMVEEFKLMVRKATNCWPDMSSQIRDFADRLFERQHIIGDNMKWDLPAEDKYELASTAKFSDFCPTCGEDKTKQV